MTVAAVILAASSGSAHTRVEGLSRVRRMADAAWSGGAVPIVVVAPDPDGTVAQALAGAPVTLAEPAPLEGGSISQILRGIEVAGAVISETDAVIVWPARMAWVDPETITSLIEAHGIDDEPIIVPTYRGEPGWPVLVPLGALARLRAILPDRGPDEVIDDLRSAGMSERRIELGDPGSVHDGSVAPADLPPFEGPTEAASGHAHEWGTPMADRPDDAPLEGPTIAAYGPRDP